VKLTALFTKICFQCVFYRPLLRSVHIYLQCVYVAITHDFPTSVVCEKLNSFLEFSPNIIYRSGPNTLPYGIPDVTLTSSDNCPLTVTLCERPRRNTLAHTSTLESNPEAAFFISNQSYGTKSKAF